jgi:hypothetical protein
VNGVRLLVRLCVFETWWRKGLQHPCRSGSPIQFCEPCRNFRSKKSDAA